VSTLSTHVLDTAAGLPAAGIRVVLQTRAGTPLDEAVTDHDGRIGSLGGELATGDYVLRFQTGAHYEHSFFPEVVVVFTISDERHHHHVPVLLSPYGYSTYRGS
jgi:5-hydroxyisourate hydrolase